ncbi:hypothetical protein L6452_32328 [Arctium lappa]|uniref:Uncharacterized protein n=1 Tax=Arctium lappa TaxID=4217 RepID=A0ACB8Z484_ARCLA|nr:hypothetical protein L6452_32328 [Arctium lappa]
MSGKQLIPTETYAYGLYGALGNLSRIGDEYQTKIPSLITDSEYLDYIKNPIEEETKAGVPSDFLIGLDIPIVWINQDAANMKEAEGDSKIAPQVDMKNEDPTSDFSSEITNMKNDHVAGTAGSIQLCLVPGRFLESWTEIERGSFLLGLYIFEKNFVRVKRFIESKNMGDILSYYYGKFYRSDEYRRWSESRKSRGRRCILGQRIFSGLRQQELLCRLIPHASQEDQNSLLEVSRTFVDGRISFEEYVFSLLNLVGIKNLVDAVAIGSGKPDLTGNGIEPTKQNQAIHIRPEIPIGKACSSLTSTEIIKFLTGDYRLSKARSNDLFWEAVWPRLLARGWHSEQPNGYNYAANGKHSLVFLMPGVKKFSRRLVKGDAYLDSVTDVLNKVASEPQLLELDDSEENGETGTKLEDEEEEDGILEKRKSHCYLQPRAPNRSTILMKFTVVDTSLSRGNIIKVRELEPMKLIARSHSDEVHSELVSSDESDSANTFLVDQETTANGPKSKKQKTSGEKKLHAKKHLKTTNGSDSVLPEATKKLTKANLSRKSKPENSDSGHYAKRRRRLSACSRMDSKACSSLERDIDDLTENIYSHVGSSSQANPKLSSNLSFSSRCSSIDTVEEQQQPQLMNLIDLNYPHITPTFGNCEFGTETVDVKDERTKPGSQKQSASMVGADEQQNGVSRRQSTRNRPPTARALEALANGFLTVNTRKKDKEKIRDSTSRSRNSHRSRGEIGVISECSTGDASSAVKGDDENGPFNGEIEK